MTGKSEKSKDARSLKADEIGGHSDLPFEQSLEKLEKIVEQLEAGELNLDKALAAFEEGMTLAQACETKLDAATGRVERIMKEFGGKERLAAAAEEDPEADTGDDDGPI